MIHRPAYPPRETRLVMRSVLIALLPGIVAMSIFFGAGVLLNLATAIVTALLSESSICANLKLKDRGTWCVSRANEIYTRARIRPGSC